MQVVLDKGNDLDWFSDPWIIAGSIFAAVALIFLVIWELTDDNPIINLRLFANRNFCIGTMVLTMGYAGFFAINLILPQWLQSQMDYTSVWAGLAAAPMGVIPLFLTPVLGRLGTRLDMRKLGALSFIVISLSCWMRSEFNMDIDFKSVAAIQLFMGIGISLFFMPMMTILLSDLKGPAIADAASLSTFIRTLGASFASSLTTWYWSHNASLHHSTLSEHINPYNPQASMFTASGTGNLLSINGTITHQSFMMSTLDLFNLLMWMFIALIPFVFLTSRPPHSGGTSGGAAH